ncbi:unnamed protein product [Linum tenue]|uniref:Uncharacterized protein n=1 Tax=Linum tenue TaxID=586396 RepID=A0AAV0QSM5_9ROSI|nr:unnamed protein product [Linum tenue]
MRTQSQLESFCQLKALPLTSHQRKKLESQSVKLV